MKSFLTSILLSLLCLFGNTANLNAWSLPETGQSKCYDNETEISCPQPGEAFFGQDAQYNIGRRSFTKLDINGTDLPDSAVSWSMVRDNVTGLIWELKTDDGTIHDVDNEYPLKEQREVFINTLNADAFGGFSDWRLPTVKELSYLLDRGRSKPCLDILYFPLSSLYYYSSNDDITGLPGPGGVDISSYYVQFNTGYAYNLLKDGGFAMAVRGESSASDNIFEDNFDGTITDKQTELMWQKSPSSQVMNWKDALAYCEDLEHDGYLSDWRLPNLYELLSIVDYSTYAPSINTDYFPLTEPAYFKTSTTYDSNASKSLNVGFNVGYVDFWFESSKENSHYVRCVRAGHCAALGGDSDSDGICNYEDNCPDTANSGQEDMDWDLVGDVCDNDIDADNILNVNDNCPEVYNHKQQDVDSDGTGDICDVDTIYGTVRGAVAGLKVELVKVGCGGESVYDNVRTNPDGYFAFGTIPQGMYLVLPGSLYVDLVPTYDYIRIPQTEVQAYDFTVNVSCDDPGENTINLSVIGDGYFMVRSDEEGINYTRSGCFLLNQENLLVNPQGYVLQGWALDENGYIYGGIGDIRIQEQSLIETVSSDGIISVKLAGETIYPASQIALAMFVYPENLQNEGSGLYSETRESGQPVTAQPGLSYYGMFSGIIYFEVF